MSGVIDKTVLLDAAAIRRALVRISHEIIEKNKGVDNIVTLKGKNRIARSVLHALNKLAAIHSTPTRSNGPRIVPRRTNRLITPAPTNAFKMPTPHFSTPLNSGENEKKALIL